MMVAERAHRGRASLGGSASGSCALTRCISVQPLAERHRSPKLGLAVNAQGSGADQEGEAIHGEHCEGEHQPVLDRPTSAG